jgi:hypothetical protein
VALGVALWLGLLAGVLSLALARDLLAGVVFVAGFVWASGLGVLLARRSSFLSVRRWQALASRERVPARRPSWPDERR